MSAITIGGTSVYPGEQCTIELDVARLVSHTPITIRVEVCRSEASGPTLLMMAGLHGDEINGIEIVRRLKILNAHQPVKGTIITIPIVNVFGFLNFSREVPDGKDVNRSFPGDPDGSLAHRIAHTMTREILPVIDIGVDFHTGGASLNNHPQVRSYLENDAVLAQAKAFRLPMVLDTPLIEGSLRKEANLRNINIIVYEGGESLRFNEAAVQAGVNGTLRFLNFMGLSNLEAPPGVEPVVVKGKNWLRAKNSGFFTSFVQAGVKVREGEVLGRVTDPYGDFEEEVAAPQHSYVIGLNNAALVHGGDALFHLGW